MLKGMGVPRFQAQAPGVLTVYIPGEGGKAPRAYPRRTARSSDPMSRQDRARPFDQGDPNRRALTSLSTLQVAEAFRGRPDSAGRFKGLEQEGQTLELTPSPSGQMLRFS